MPDLKSRIEKLYLDNRRTTEGYQYTVPSPDTYPYQWLWDSCFHAIVLCHINVEDSKKELLSLVSKQFSNGMIPHMIYWDQSVSSSFPKVKWGKKDTSTITQPPMLAYAAWKIYQTDSDKKFLTQIYPNLKRFYNFFIKDRDYRNHHIISIINPDELGEDNSPRFDIAFNLPPKHTLDENFEQRLNLVEKNMRCNFDGPQCMRNFFWVKDVSFNSILVENLKILSAIAAELRFDEDSDYFYQQSLLISQAMRQYMLEDGLLWSTHGLDYQKIKVKTWAMFAPLFAQIATPAEASSLVNDFLLNPEEFGLPYLVPTVSKSEESFDPNGFWRGPCWVGTNWFIYQGLIKYGFKKEADKIADSTLTLIEKSGFREQYDPFTAEGYGAKDFTWGGLILDMIGG